MSRKKVISLLVFVFLINIVLLSLFDIQSAQANTIRYGARGNDVIELQQRLNQLGYYKMNVDGIFGWGTHSAVRRFQSDYGLTVDGIVGPRTWNALRSNTAQTPARATAGGFSAQDINLLVHLVNGEARGEPYIGQVAIIAVVMNRVRSPIFPNTVSGVIFEPRAFTAVDDGQIWLTPQSPQLRQAVLDAINGWDPSGGALYYFNPITATSKWIWSRPQIKQIGRHIFCR
ncbi:spore cortex-lytic enzyme [Desulfuribacillus stibiiarsenatis]|uniref:Spore cortex-lytic enzyme n=1 Tax=Desulfuribacillus stibiiarsenatis TaxID=1390249 RepID=A0A1E5L3S2_9FIRM|nr:spore cortex-lytic enzyme [Desulfuribacillus stibiiarsenatis]OEH84744.1 spore cortex-lytic enzyme [Desulfuribacillus stibiiarsenatis]